MVKEGDPVKVLVGKGASGGIHDQLLLQSRLRRPEAPQFNLNAGNEGLGKPLLLLRGKPVHGLGGGGFIQ